MVCRQLRDRSRCYKYVFWISTFSDGWCVSGQLASYSSSLASPASRPYVTKLLGRNFVQRCEDVFCCATETGPEDFSQLWVSEPVLVGPFHILRDWDIVPGEWPDYRPSTRSHFCFNHRLYCQKPFTSPQSGFSDWKHRMSPAEESESGQPHSNAMPTWPPQTHSRSWVGAEACIKNY